MSDPPPLFCRGLRNGVLLSLLLWALIVLLSMLSAGQPRPLCDPLSSLPWMRSGCV